MSSSGPGGPGQELPESLSSRESWLEPFEWYERMRAEAPVRYVAERQCYDVFRYEDVKAILHDPQLFSSDPTNATGFDESQFPGDERPSILDTILFEDPPRHTRLRSVVADFFRPRAVADLEPHIRELTNDLVDDVADDGEMDLVEHVAYPLPVIVIAELLGVPVEDRDQFREWSNTVIETPVVTIEAEFEEYQRRQRRAQRELQEYFHEMIERRRGEPQDDLISNLLSAEVDDERLSESELLGFCILLLIAGNITTTNLVTNAFRCFAVQPSLFRQFEADTNGIGKAIEEVLRYRSPVQALSRVATTDATVGEVEIEAGDRLVCWLGSANRDKEQFSDAATFVPDRAPNQHLGFGYGTHYCLGAPLARLEAKVVLTELFDRFDDIAVDDSDLSPVRSAFIYGVESLPMRFEA